MLTLVPGWANNYDEFWTAIRRRNLWLIKLRYVLCTALVAFMYLGNYILGFNLSEFQINAVLTVSLSILLYNILLHYLRQYVSLTPGKFNAMHLSLVQILLDLLTLMLLVYITGLIYSPIYVFFIFQLIVGSIILPGYLIYIIATLVILIYSMLVVLQHYGSIETHVISGLYPVVFEHGLTFDIVFLIVFATMILFAVFLANTMAKRLYQREQQLRNSLDQIEEMEESKQKYIMGLVHEIKTPIAAVQSFLELIIDNFLGPVSDIVLDKLTKAKIRTEESISLINNVLQISKLKLLNLTTPEEIDISELLRSIITKREESANAKNVDLFFIDNIKQQHKIKGDRLLLELAFSNIIGNSIKYYSGIDGRVEVIVSGSKSGLKIKFVDNGIGIPDKETKKIFDQFYRATNIRGTDKEGSGLGLSLVKEIIEKHNGNVVIKSPSGIGSIEKPGTTVAITLPNNLDDQNNFSEDDKFSVKGYLKI